MVFLAGRDTTPLTDTRYTLHVALSLLRQGNIDLDEYPYAASEGYELRGHRYSYFPIGTPLMITPFAFVMDRSMAFLGSRDLYESLKTQADWDFVARFNLVIASLLTAITCGVIFKIGRLFLDRWRAAVLMFIFAFGTSAWSTASRDLWQHSASILFLSIALYLLLLASERPQLVQYVGLLLTCAFIIRPTNSLSLAVITVFVFFQYRNYAARYLLWALLPAVAFLSFNVIVFGSILPSYFAPQRLGSTQHFFEALVGNLFSPARGVLIYTPVLALVGYGAWRKRKDGQLTILDRCLLGIVVAHWLIISAFPHWWGGASYGPRFFTDMLPYLVYFLIPVLNELRGPATKRVMTLAMLFAVLALISFVIHLRGAFDARTWEWNGAWLNVVPSVDDDPSRVWDWSDPQFWRGLRPARLAVMPVEICFVVDAGDTPPVVRDLMIRNLGDRGLIWNAEWPHRVYDQPAETRVPALGYGEVHLSVDHSGLAEGIYRLGSAYLTARGQDDRPVRETPAVIPITLQVLAPGAKAATSHAAGECSDPSSDRWLNSHPSGSGRDQLQATFGAGWYDLEQQADFSWRWAASPARILVNSPVSQHITLASTLVAAYRRDGPFSAGEPVALTITTEDGETRFNASVGQPFNVELNLAPGWNTLAFASEAGSLRPADIDPQNSDQRKLIGKSLRHRTNSLVIMVGEQRTGELGRLEIGFEVRGQLAQLGDEMIVTDVVACRFPDVFLRV